MVRERQEKRIEKREEKKKEKEGKKRKGEKHKPLSNFSEIGVNLSGVIVANQVLEGNLT